MKSSQIERVINLIRRTGDRCVMMDNSSDDVLVMMHLHDYENLLDGDSDKKKLITMSEREMMDKVDRDMAYWRSLHPEENVGHEEINYNNFPPAAKKGAEKAEEKNTDDFPEDAFVEEDFLGGEIPEETEKNLEDFETASEENDDFEEEESFFGHDTGLKMEENLDDLPHEDEDTFLLEPV